MQLVQPINKCQNVMSCRRGGGAGSDDRGCRQKKKSVAFLKDAYTTFFHYLARSWRVPFKCIY